MTPVKESCDATSSEHGSIESAIKCDDASTTDSGSVIEEEMGNGNGNGASTMKPDSDFPDDDEGIYMGVNVPGPYVYELFSIMIHSGSATGGHYYAYIKDFENGLWLCFNDQTVQPIGREEIEKSYGGGYATNRTYYSSVYTSSTNAYMLMYRQINRDRNVGPIKTDQLPDHIKVSEAMVK